MKIKKDLNDFFATFKESKRDVFLFAMLSIILAIGIIYPLMISLYRLSIKASGYSVITLYNIIPYVFKSPFTIPILIVIAFIYIMFFLFQISTMAVICDKNLTKLSFAGSLRFGLKKTFSYFKKQNIGYFFLLMAIIPLTAFMVQGYDTLKLTNEIWNYVFNNSMIALVSGMVLVFIILLISKYILALNIFATTSNDFTFRQALQRSKRVTIKNYYRLVTSVVKVNLLLIIAYYIVYYFVVLLLFLITKACNPTGTTISIVLGICYGFNIALKYIMHFVFLLSNVGVLAEINNRDNEFAYDLSLVKESELSDTNIKLTRSILYSLTGILMVFSGLIFFFKAQSGLLYSVNYVENVKITAHRGYSKNVPNNTIEAFGYAIDLHADAIELDLQYTKDGQVVCYHDETLLEVGSTKKIADYTYLELKQYKLTKNGIEYEIPLFDDVLEKYANRTRFNCELKINSGNIGSLTEFCDAVHKIVDKNNCGLTVSFSSFNRDALLYMKEEYKYQIGLITNVIVKSEELKKYDYISIEYKQLDSKSVLDYHNLGLEVHAWTVNDSIDVYKCIEYNVDNIITDSPDMAKKIMYADTSDLVLRKVIGLFFNSDEDIYKLILK